MDSPRSRDRIIDANLHRAAEGLRVAEDICRFHWNLQGLAQELKSLRHELLDTQDDASRRRQALARDAEGDVGRRRDGPGPSGRRPDASGAEDLGRTAAANLERSREALRALEEVSRFRAPDFAGACETIRYRLYTLEKALARLEARGERALRLEASRLCVLVSARLCRGGLASTVEAAIRGGADVIQLREKDGADRTVLERARALREVTARHGVLFIVNDRPDLALLSHADGVHLGRDDLSAGDARVLLGAERLVGLSTHSPSQAAEAVRAGADYIGAGPLYATTTKDAGPRLSPEGLSEIIRDTPIPVFAIGGVGAANVGEIARLGCRRVAVCSAVVGSADAEAACRRLLEGLGSPEAASAARRTDSR